MRLTLSCSLTALTTIMFNSNTEQCNCTSKLVAATARTNYHAKATSLDKAGSKDCNIVRYFERLLNPLPQGLQ
ncbi:hypothetical protein BD769DRAFT_190334 [Suillus cothurnatus]|nr:hypothetical protein BD769DRAFT_190334 [Suillus cothurnatus]